MTLPLRQGLPFLRTSVIVFSKVSKKLIVNRWRIFFLLLLALLLPIRGALAAAMLCGVSSPSGLTELSVGDGTIGHEEMTVNMEHSHGAGGHEHESTKDVSDADLHGWQDHGATSKCNMCSAFCGLTLLVSNAPALNEPLDLAQVKHSDPAALSPSHISDGQERPPRTI
ncbi:hypothetical protein [Variovorax sp. HJSM1_2]|uniref:hypothetical protein n=1 Tax=Variovorax sp. HJSM1_2 TaxID=3366263 RepID=UPI003BE7E03B